MTKTIISSVLLVITLFLSGCVSLADTQVTPSTTLAPIIPSATVEPTNTSSPSLIPTETILPSPTATPNPWKTYSFRYFIETNDAEQFFKIWIPVPQEWNGQAIRNVQIIEIYPTLTNIIEDQNGNKIAYWNVTDKSVQEYGISFQAELSTLSYDVGASDIFLYDMEDELYVQYTQPTTQIQSNHPEIVAQAQAIIGDATNPYNQAYLIWKWVSENIATDGPSVDALTALRTKEADCSVNRLYIAMLRAVGIPARLISEIHAMPFPSAAGTYLYSFDDNTLAAHVYAEFYLPEYGWIQSDTPWEFMGNQWLRIILTKGEDIRLNADELRHHIHHMIIWRSGDDYMRGMFLEVTLLE